MAQTLEQLLTELRAEAAVLEKHGDSRAARLITGIVERVRTAAEDYCTWLEEDKAMLRSAHNVRWFLARFDQWEKEGNAKKERGKRYYRQLIVPQRARVSAARASGRAAGRAAAAAASARSHAR